jgi:RNA polymerase sigma-54 factor
VRLDQSQVQRLSQEMRLSPRLIQAMEILQLPMCALEERIAAEMETNPVLEQVEPGRDEPAGPAEDLADDFAERDMVVEEGGASEDFERLDNMTEMYGEEFANSDAPMPSRAAALEAGDRKLEAMANAPAAEQTLGEYLREQWMFIEASESVQAAGVRIIEHIDPDGYLRTPLVQLLEPAEGSENESPSMQGITLDALEEALGLVQALEPTGVGARDLRECLLLQLAAAEAAGEDVALARQLVVGFLREIEMNRLPLIVRRTGRGLEQIKAWIRAPGF